MNGEEFESLYAALRNNLFAYAASRLSPQEALDVVHATFEVVWRKRSSAPMEPSEWPAWCFGIARNLVRQEAQRKVRKHHDNRFHEDHSSVTPADRDTAEIVVEAQLGHQILDSLSPNERELIVVALGTEANGTEAAELLGTSYSAYTTRVSRLRKRLKHMLDGTEDVTARSGDAS